MWLLPVVSDAANIGCSLGRPTQPTLGTSGHTSAHCPGPDQFYQQSAASSELAMPKTQCSELSWTPSGHSGSRPHHLLLGSELSSSESANDPEMQSHVHIPCKIRRSTFPTCESLSLRGAEFHDKALCVPGRFSFIDTFTHQNIVGLSVGSGHTVMSKPSPVCPHGA